MTNNNEINNLGEMCCFCDHDIQPNQIDPCNINIMGHWYRKVERQTSQDYFFHFECLQKCLHENYKESKNSNREGEAQNCYFCNQIIQQTNINPCSINIVYGWDKPRNQQISYSFCCHILCLKSSLHDDYKKYFIEQTFRYKK